MSRHRQPKANDAMGENIECPFGSETDVMVVCKDELQRTYLAKALRMKARYVLWGQSILGRRAKKIIVFWPPEEEMCERISQYRDYFECNIRCRLAPDGVLIEV